MLAFCEQKLEALKLQAAIAAKEQEKEEKELRAAEAREQKRRDLQQKQVCITCNNYPVRDRDIVLLLFLFQNIIYSHTLLQCVFN